MGTDTLCGRHKLPAVGSVCGEDFCTVCSQEFQEWLNNQRTPDSFRVWQEDDAHHKVWRFERT